MHMNASNLIWSVHILHSIASNPFQIIRIWIRMLRISFKCLEFGFETFLSRLEFGFKYIKSLSNSSSLHSNASNSFRKVWICIWFLRISLEGFEFALECFEYFLNGLNLHSNALNTVWMVQIWIRMLRIPFEWFEFTF